jgi:hypothetical protein
MTFSLQLLDCRNNPRDPFARRPSLLFEDVQTPLTGRLSAPRLTRRIFGPQGRRRARNLLVAVRPARRARPEVIVYAVRADKRRAKGALTGHSVSIAPIMVVYFAQHRSFSSKICWAQSLAQ